MEVDDGTRGWGAELQTEPRRLGGGGSGRWLKEEKDVRANLNGHTGVTSENHAENKGKGPT